MDLVIHGARPWKFCRMRPLFNLDAAILYGAPRTKNHTAGMAVLLPLG
jgi:hypothetical protein